MLQCCNTFWIAGESSDCHLLQKHMTYSNMYQNLLIPLEAQTDLDTTVSMHLKLFIVAFRLSGRIMLEKLVIGSTKKNYENVSEHMLQEESKSSLDMLTYVIEYFSLNTNRISSLYHITLYR